MTDNGYGVQELNGVGPATEDDFNHAGIVIVEDVATASDEELEDVEDMDLGTAQEFREQARDLLELDEDDFDGDGNLVDPQEEEGASTEGAESDTETIEWGGDGHPSENIEDDQIETEAGSGGTEDEPDQSDVVDTQDEPVETQEAEVETHSVNLSYEEEFGNHVIAALVEVEVNEYQRKQHDKVEQIRELEEQFHGGEGEVALEVTPFQLNALYRAVNQRQQDYHSNRGVAGMTGHLRDVSEQVQEARAEHLF